MEQQFKQIIPAQPGYFVLGHYPDDDAGTKWAIFKMPVVAWGVVEDDFTIKGVPRYLYWLSPIALDCECPDDKPILYPDGSIVSQGDCSWGSVDEYIAWLVRTEGGKKR